MTGLYKTTLNDRLANYGVNIELTTERLKSFYQVTNTYLSVFGVFGALGNDNRNRRSWICPFKKL